MVNIIAHGFEKVNKIGLDCQSSRLSASFAALCINSANAKNSIKNRPAKKQGVVGAGQRGRTSISFQGEKYSGN